MRLKTLYLFIVSYLLFCCFSVVLGQEKPDQYENEVIIIETEQEQNLKLNDWTIKKYDRENPASTFASFGGYMQLNQSSNEVLKIKVNFYGIGRYYFWVKTYGAIANQSISFYKKDSQNKMENLRLKENIQTWFWNGFRADGEIAYIDINKIGEYEIMLNTNAEKIGLDAVMFSKNKNYDPNLGNTISTYNSKNKVNFSSQLSAYSLGSQLNCKAVN
jgi:hypothetical protein